MSTEEKKSAPTDAKKDQATTKDKKSEKKEDVLVCYRMAPKSSFHDSRGENTALKE
jgi:hypothetical protein